MLHRIIYLSSVSKDLTNEEVHNLLLLSKINNKKNNISGLLLFIDGNFIQVLEGDKDTINDLFQKIEKDTRHKNVTKVIEDTIESRQFENWDMGFSVINSKDLREEHDFKNFDFDNIFSKTDFIAETFISTFLKCNRSMIK